MNSKNITVIKDDICEMCQKEKATHTYSIYGRGYGSIFDNQDIEFRCCDKCNNSKFKKWFNELPTEYDFAEHYQYEDELYKMLTSLPINSQEKIFNGTNGYKMESQDWIDYELKELPHTKCEEYGLYSSEEIQAYRDRFPNCERVYKKIFTDGTSCCLCNKGAYGNSDGSCDENICEECYMCTLFEPRKIKIKTIYEDREKLEREKQRLIDMYQYSIDHLTKLGINIKNNKNENDKELKGQITFDDLEN